MSVLRKPKVLTENDVTPESMYLNRRAFIKAGIVGTAAASMGGKAALASIKPGNYKKSVVTVDEELTEFEKASSYNNFYEFGTGKSDPARNSKDFNTDDWRIKVSGECEKPGEYLLEDMLKGIDIEERIYRLRCVEAWSMVIPWLGVPLLSLLKKYQPTSKAKYVAFKTLYDPKQMPGQKRPVLDWPYVEGLRMDEAMHPLTILAVGMYGKTMPNQNGAPIRLVVPWKYGFKSIKSIVSIEFTEIQPPATWNLTNPGEYGFYSNVNPNVSHPRWSQAKERRIGDFFKRDTLMFNGYAEEVAGLYSGMDLKKYY